jgi:hypothetical protein
MLPLIFRSARLLHTQDTIIQVLLQRVPDLPLPPQVQLLEQLALRERLEWLLLMVPQFLPLAFSRHMPDTIIQVLLQQVL